MAIGVRAGELSREKCLAGEVREATGEQRVGEVRKLGRCGGVPPTERTEAESQDGHSHSFLGTRVRGGLRHEFMW